MEELINSIRVRSKYNKMEFKEFVKELELYLDTKFDKNIKENWKFTGLNNIDFITMYVDY